MAMQYGIHAVIHMPNVITWHSAVLIRYWSQTQSFCFGIPEWHSRLHCCQCLLW